MNALSYSNVKCTPRIPLILLTVDKSGHKIFNFVLFLFSFFFLFAYAYRIASKFGELKIWQIAIKRLKIKFGQI